MAKFSKNFMNAAQDATASMLNRRRMAIELGLNSATIAERTRGLNLPSPEMSKRLDIMTEPAEVRKKRMIALHEKARVHRKIVEEKQAQARAEEIKQKIKNERLEEIRQRGERQRAERPAKQQVKKQKKQQRINQRKNAPKVRTMAYMAPVPTPPIAAGAPLASPVAPISTSASSRTGTMLPMSPLAKKMAIGAAALGAIGITRFNKSSSNNVGQQPPINSLQDDQIRDYLQNDG